MHSTNRLCAANAIVKPGRELERFLRAPDAVNVIKRTHVNWMVGELLEAPPEMQELLHKIEGIEPSSRKLSQSALRLLGKLQIDLESAARESPLAQRFEILGVIGRGGNSIALKATNKSVGRTVVLKILRPIQPDLAEAAIRKLGTLENIPHLIAPIDSQAIDLKSHSGDPVRLYCIIFPYIQAITLDRYLASKPPISPYFFEAFIRQIGGVLRKLEAEHLQHGDLHGANIQIGRASC